MKTNLSLYIFTCIISLNLSAQKPVIKHTQDLINRSGKNEVKLKEVSCLGHDEAFRVVQKNSGTTIEYQNPAGALYGAQAVIHGDYKPGRVEKPDFDIRGTTLCLMPHAYTATLSPELYPWFYDKEFMTRTLDAFTAERLNTIFLWAGHLFPYIVEMPDYPEANSDVSPEQIKANQEQFRWFTNECEKRNIKVLLHFYNIHVSPPFAKKHNMPTNPKIPTSLLEKYTHYALTRYFKEFASVGLYACPGESIESDHQLGWFRDIIFDAAKKSGKNPLIVIRDWTTNMDFRDQIKDLYDNVYTELKHNDESFSSPYPDLRHLQLEGTAPGHVVNFHLMTDVVPMRWGSPVMLAETMQNLKKLGFVKGVEFYGVSFWKWPYTLDKLEPNQNGYIPEGPKLISLDRDEIYYKSFGRYLWQAHRNPLEEEEYWTQFLSKKFESEKVGELIYKWYLVSGPIGPGLQNLNQTRVAGWWPSPMLHIQKVDEILEYNNKLDDTPYTLYKETGRAKQRFYPRPFDEYFFGRYQEAYDMPKAGNLPAMYKEFDDYKVRMGIPNLEQRHCMPVSQYTKMLEEGSPANKALVPDKVIALLNELAKESHAIANKAVSIAKKSGVKEENINELERFVTDSKLYMLSTEVMIHKEQAAILKARLLIKPDSGFEEQFMYHMEQSVKIYEELAEFTSGTYLHGNDLMGSHWKDAGLKEFTDDLQKQREWLDEFKKQHK